MRVQWRARDGARPGLTVSQEARLRELGFEFGRHVPWDARIAQLQGLKARQGHLGGRLPNLDAFEGLRDWAKRQRALRRAGRLAADRVATLDAVGFEWDPEQGGWNRDLAALDKYMEKHSFTVR